MSEAAEEVQVVGVGLEFEEMSDEVLNSLHSEIGHILESRRATAKEAAVQKVKEVMAAAGISYRDVAPPSPSRNSSPRSSSRIPQYGKDKMLPALQEILKNGPMEQNELRATLKNKYNLPFHTIGMLVRYKDIHATDDGKYALGPRPE